jgi:hypothetical protein
MLGTQKPRVWGAVQSKAPGGATVKRYLLVLCLIAAAGTYAAFRLGGLRAMTAEILECGHPATPQAPGSITTGYGTDANGARHCFACCAENDRREMVETGRAVLYLTGNPEKGWTVTNWPGTLRFPVHHTRTSRCGGGFGAQRTDAWFTGPDGKCWHAINRGDMDLARCRRIKG